ncbi:MAG TPA: adenosylcobinamide-GDP ribazoletransferase [Clostridiaceae bacterium]|nr:adenosylcobinamide-GDP ribazoletransferase [Clostridiaceae bacterium]
MKRFLNGFFMSLGMFCAIPVPYKKWNESCANLVIPFFPMVGLLIGLLWYGVSRLLYLAGLSAVMLSAFLMLFPYVITGFLHIDGFMDASDAILSRRPLEEKLKILKDPHTGAFAVVSVLVLFVICFAGAYEVVSDTGKLPYLVFLPVISRSLTGLTLLSLKVIPQSGYGSYFKKNIKPIHRISLALAGFFAAAALCLLFSVKGLIVVLAMAAGFFLSILSAYRQFGGISGDVSGYALTVSEACGLIVLALV